MVHVGRSCDTLSRMNTTPPLSSLPIIDDLATAIILIDARLHIVDANTAAEQLLQQSVRYLRGQHVGRWLKVPRFTIRRLQVLLQQQNRCHLHQAPIRVNAQRTLTADIAVSRLKSDPHQFLVEIQHLAPTGLLLSQANQLPDSAMHHVLRNLAHEVRNPLAGLRGAAQLLAKKISPSERRLTDIVIREVDRLADLVERLLGHGQREPKVLGNVHQVLEEALALVLMEKPPGLTIRRDYDPSLPDIAFRRHAFYQAILNLLRNAIQALAGQGGEIRITTRIARGVIIRDVAHRTAIRVEIADNGPGLPEHVYKNLFAPLNPGRPNGLGLGLSIAHQAIVSQGGAIQCQTSAEGTCFSIYMPITDHEQQTSKTHSAGRR